MGRFKRCLAVVVFCLAVLAPFSSAAPTLSSVAPSSGFQGATLNLTIAGGGFGSSPNVVFGGGGVIVNGVRDSSTPVSSSIVLNVTLLGEPGARTISITDEGTSNNLAFEILPSPISNSSAARVAHFAGPEGGIGIADGRGADARFYVPSGIWSDGTSLYVADYGAAAIRKISIATRDVTTLVGGVIPTTAFPSIGKAAMWGDGANLYVVDECEIRRVVIATGDSTTFSGNSTEPCSVVDGGPDVARFQRPEAIWGDGANLYVVEQPHTPFRFEPAIPGAIRVISLTTREVRTIPIPFINSDDGIERPLGIWGISGYLYTTWLSPAGSLSFARINVATSETEWLFSAPFQCCSGFSPAGLWFDGRENFYFVEGLTLRRLALPTGRLTSVATLPKAGYNMPVAIWGVGNNLYVTDLGAAIVSRVDISTGDVVVFAGLHSNAPPVGEQGQSGFVNGAWGDGSNLYAVVDDSILKIASATSSISVFATDLREPHEIWGDGTSLYVVDSGNRRIQRIALTTGAGTTLTSGLIDPLGIWGDSTYLYVTDNTVVRRIVKATGESTVLAGAERAQGSANGVGTAARFSMPVGIWGDGAYLYVVDSEDQTVRRISIATSEVTTLAGGSRQAGYINGNSATARFRNPYGISGDGTNLYVGDFGNSVIRKVVIPTGEVSTFLNYGSTPYWNDRGMLYFRTLRGNALERVSTATLELTRVMPALEFSDGMVPADRIPVNTSWGDGEFLYGAFASAIYKVSTLSGEITHVAGGFDEAGLVDGIGNAARFVSPEALWGNGASLYVEDSGWIRRIDLSTSKVTTVANTGGGGDIWGAGGFLYVTAQPALTTGGRSNRTIERINSSTGEITRLAGDSDASGSVNYRDGTGRAARFLSANALWSDGAVLYVGDACSIRKVTLASSEVSTFVGIPDSCAQVDGPPQTARFNSITDIWGNGRSLFVTSAHTVRAVDLLTGQVRTVAGDAIAIGTENGPASNARFLRPGSIWGDGLSLYVSDNGLRRITYAAATQAYNIPPGGADYWKTTSSSDALTIAYARLQAARGNASPDGVAVFSYRVNGVLVSESSVPALPLIEQGRIYAESDGRLKTGIAIANPGAQTATVSFYFTDSAGSTIGSGATTIAANRQIAVFLTEAPFNGPADARSFTFTASLPVAATALRGYTNERSEFLMTTLPVAPVRSAAARAIVLPHFAAGGGWLTQVLLINPTDESITGTLGMDGEYRYSIAPRSAAKVESLTTGPEVKTGMVRITPAVNSSSPIASTIFSYRTGGVTVSETGATASVESQDFRVFAEVDSTQSLETGFAIANGQAAAAFIRIELSDLNGAPTGRSGSLTIPANGHAAMFLNEVPGFQALSGPFRGILHITGDRAISVVGLRERFNERGDFLISTTPATPAEFNRNEELIFPQVVTGGGYTTEFILMGQGAASNGTVSIYSQAGAELPLLLAR